MLDCMLFLFALTYNKLYWMDQSYFRVALGLWFSCCYGFLTKDFLLSVTLCYEWAKLLVWYLYLRHVQESAKTKHPQLHYESKLYMILQGGSTYLFPLFFNHRMLCSVTFLIPKYIMHFNLCVLPTTSISLQRVFPISNGLELKANTMSWLLTFLVRAWRIYLIIVIGNFPWKQF